MDTSKNLLCTPEISLIPSLLHKFPRFSTTFLNSKFHSCVLDNQLYCQYKAFNLCFILAIDLQIIHKEQVIYFFISKGISKFDILWDLGQRYHLNSEDKGRQGVSLKDTPSNIN